MAGTNAIAVKKALFDRLTVILSDVQVAYSFPGATVQRECVYGGKTAGTQLQAAMRAGGRGAREEQITIAVHILVTAPGGPAEVYDTDSRAVEIGTAMEEYLAANPTLEGASGVLNSVVSSFDMEDGVDDDSASTILTYQVDFHSYLT